MKKMQKYTLILNQEDLTSVPDVIKIVPKGKVSSEKGDFLVNEESFEQMKQQFQRRGLDLVIDYEHQTLKDVQAPAAGWIKEITQGEDAILAKVEWTSKGAEYLKNKEYKYLSPVIRVRKKDSLAIGLHSVALTNTPAIDHMFPLVLKNTEEEEEMEFLKEIAAKLGIAVSEEMSDEEIAKAIFSAIPAQDGAEEVIANKNILTLLGLSGSAKEEDVTAAIMALKQPKEEGWKEKYDQLKERLDKKEADELVLKALTSGKITADQKDWAQDYALSNKESFEKFLEKAPQIVPMGRMELSSQEKKSFEMDDTALMMCKALGVSSEDFKKYAAKEEE